MRCGIHSFAILKAQLSGKEHARKRRTLRVHVCKLARGTDAEGVTKTDFVS